MNSYSSNQVALEMFNDLIEKEKKKLTAYMDVLLEPLREKGRKALEEFLEGEKRIQEETFSRN